MRLVGLIAGVLAASVAVAAAQQREGLREQGDELLGWTFEPEIAEQDGTELDRLSRSPSRALGGNLYGGTPDDPRVPVSVTLRALDKVTARFTDLTVPIGEATSFGSLTLLPQTCYKRPPEEFPETTVFLQVFPTQSDVQGRRIRAQLNRAGGDSGTGRTDGVEPLFSGWMFASSPALNALEHPVYDVWVINCKMEAPDI